MTSGSSSDRAAWLLPPEARTEWLTLARVLAEHMPPPCEEGEPEAWWPSPRSPADPVAVEGCGRCPARSPCLAYALAADERFGVWGGLLPDERREMRRQAA
jgi:hypothetical protein